jgi:GTPase SAR1 family protein
MPSGHKIVLVGDQAVGKTSLLANWTESVFDGEQAPTFGCACVSREVVVSDVPHKIQFWDTAG